ncbi:MAG: Glu-tRNA(Gln) amidotransferase subunit GatE [Nitrososphaerota archaeon]|nr:Glu-tRNA(Gln) amidotransferase subunit GatE [Nitrososphaerota archaeon]MDG7011006.1 Glu-tRNA(Gln) amidotransferase subunit GatE [Nitrososphaerota archaeon]
MRDKEGLLVGLEIHQQLAIPTKLFCACPPVKTDEFPYHFERRLRPSQSETGRLDPAAVFEYAKGRSNRYYWSPESACLVEADEEPPHPMSGAGLEAALLVGTVLGSQLVDEVHVMRKIVIDGSNTGGFQRTAVVGLGGSFEVNGGRVGVQSVTLEEDAARILGEDSESRHFALDRLGVALVEVSLDPVRGAPEHVGEVALHLGRLLRSTGRVARGLGTIRQDLNVSLAGGKVVEVKGVQKLNLLPRVVEYERKRQSMLIGVAEKLREKGIRKVSCRHRDVTSLLGASSSGVVRRAVSEGGVVHCIAADGLAGLLGWEPEPGVRLGKELAEVARANSLGGVIHSDEFERQGLTGAEAAALAGAMGADHECALILVAGRSEAVSRVVPLVEARAAEAPSGVPPETRAATDSGETRYMRPRPGSQRMYPETDIQDIEVGDEVRRRLEREAPLPWTESVERLQRAFTLSRDLALKVYDSETTGEFEALAARLGLEPSFIASVLVDLPARLEREGVPESAVGLGPLTASLEAVAAGKVAKEALPEVLKASAEKGVTVDQAIRSLGLGVVTEEYVSRVVREVVGRQTKLVAERGEDAFSPLMGEAMKELRGKADGSMVARLLRRELGLARSGEGSTGQNGG